MAFDFSQQNNWTERGRATSVANADAPSPPASLSSVVRWRMIVPVQYRYVSWNPPYLTEEQQLELGRQIAIQGRDCWVREFRESIGKPKSDTLRPKPSPAFFYLFILCLAGMFYFYLFTESGRQLAVRKLLPALIPIMVIVMGIWYGSVYLSTRRFEKWVDSLIAKYAAHVARGGH